MGSWENKPWVWFGVVVIAGVVTGVATAAIQKWWGLKLAQKTVSAQVQSSANLGKYRAVY